jgi:hypothetical protein
MLRFYFYSGVEYDQNPKFIKAFYEEPFSCCVANICLPEACPVSK